MRRGRRRPLRAETGGPGCASVSVLACFALILSAHRPSPIAPPRPAPGRKTEFTCARARAAAGLVGSLRARDACRSTDSADALHDQHGAGGAPPA